MQASSRIFRKKGQFFAPNGPDGDGDRGVERQSGKADRGKAQGRWCDERSGSSKSDAEDAGGEADSNQPRQRQPGAPQQSRPPERSCKDERLDHGADADAKADAERAPPSGEKESRGKGCDDARDDGEDR